MPMTRHDDRNLARVGAARASVARQTGWVECTLLSGAGLLRLIDPLSAFWPAVEQAFRSANPPVERASGRSCMLA